VDPVRAGLATAFGCAVALFGSMALTASAARRERADSVALAVAAWFAGLAIAASGLVLVVTTMPAVSTAGSVPVPVRVPLVVGFALAAIGLGASLRPGLAAAIRRRDRGVLAAIVVIAVLIAVELLRRP
jgi:hypothetical protein